MHSIFFSTDACETKMMSKFSSLKNLETFTKGKISVDIGASIFRSFNDAYKDIVDSFDEVVYLVNSKSGWTFY